MVADSLAEGARGCKRMHEPGKMSARFRLADAAGMASAKPVRSSGVFIRMSRHLSSCSHARLLVLSTPTDLQKESAPSEVRDSCCRKSLDFGQCKSNSHHAKVTIEPPVRSGRVTLCCEAGCLAIMWLMQGCLRNHIGNTCTVLTGHYGESHDDMQWDCMLCNGSSN